MANHPIVTAECPTCEADAVLVIRTDRYYHVDGSDNRDCWTAYDAQVAAETA